MPRTTKRSNGPDSQADLHGVSATTNFSSPLFIINGPIRKRLDVNCGVGVFGPGWRPAGGDQHVHHGGPRPLHLLHRRVRRGEPRTIAGDGWSKKDIQRFLWEFCQKPVKDLLAGKDGGEGLPEHVLAKIQSPETDETLIPKFRAPEHLKILVAGGTAGRFSALIPGWTFPNGSNLVIKKIQIRE